MKVQNHFNHVEQFEAVDPLSKTIPDQSMTISELVARYARGLPIDSGKVPIFCPEELHNDALPDLTGMCMADRMEYMGRYRKELQAIADRLTAIKADEAANKLASEKELSDNYSQLKSKYDELIKEQRLKAEIKEGK